MASSTRS